MIKQICLIIFLLGAWTVSAQNWPQQIISINTDGAYRAIPADLNSDSYIDVLVLTGDDDKIIWYENLDGEGNFGPQILIDQFPVFFLSFDIIDLDTDGDNDLLYLVNNPRKLVWRENVDGQGNFGPEQIILIDQPEFVTTVITEDIDTDGDLDLIVEFGTYFYDRIVWFENLDGIGSFSDEILLINEDIRLTPPLLVDIDNDGLLDILTAHDMLDPAKIIWFKNLGNVTFGSEQIIYEFDFYSSDNTSVSDMNFVDVNLDGKEDILFDAVNDSFYFSYWLENLDEQGNFSDLIVREFPLRYFHDIDNDMDSDILSVNYASDIIYWREYEEISGTFGTIKLISDQVNGILRAQAADINGDGHLDVVSVSQDDDKIAWYENSGLGISENSLKQVKLTPNPTNGIIQVTSEAEIRGIEVYDLLGARILSLKNTTQIDLSHNASGVYVVKILGEDGVSETHKIIKE